MAKISGADGCKGGWIAFHFDGAKWSSGLYADIKELYGKAKANLILIDIPIGLRENEPCERLCDIEARGLLDKRKSSVFPAPSRLALTYDDYSEASRKNKNVTGRGLSKQSFALIPKIGELDKFLQSGAYLPNNNRIREVHPEICFWGLNGGAEMSYKKRDALGKCERLELLRNYIREVDALFDMTRGNHKKKDVADDDIIDALGCAVTALFCDSLSSLPANPEKDNKGIVMKIVYYDASQSLQADKISTKASPRW